MKTVYLLRYLDGSWLRWDYYGKSSSTLNKEDAEFYFNINDAKHVVKLFSDKNNMEMSIVPATLSVTLQ